MNCQEFESTLNEVLDDRKDPSEDLNLTNHSDQCDDCKELLGLYSSIAGYSHTVDTLGDHSSKLRWKSAYVLAATAAAVLLLLSPIGLWNKAPEVVNVAQLDSKDRALSVDNFESTKSKTDPSFWADRPLAKIVRIEKFPFSVPEAPNLQSVGASINSVWKSIKEDDFFLPIIRQGALIWVQST